MKRIAAFSIALLVLVGCSSSSQNQAGRSGVVTGKVTYKGTAINGGALLLYADAKASPLSFPINQDGTFRISDIPDNTYIAVVKGSSGGRPTNKKMSPEEVAKVEQMKGTATISFPKKFQDVKTSTLKVLVGKGGPEQDLKMED